MKILFVASEAMPFVKTGGLADVVGSLPKALAKLGHDVRILIPYYGSIDLHQFPSTVLIKNEVPVIFKKEMATLRSAHLQNGIQVYFIENRKYFGGEETYSSNDPERFLFFSRAVAQLLPQLDWQPDIVHCHDWHTALLVMFLKRSRSPYALLFTLHNLAYQGNFDNAFLLKSGLYEYWRDLPEKMPQPPLNFMSQGILWADLVSTVSKNYAREILTRRYGEGLEFLLRYRKKDLFGITNGIDYDEYDPGTDPYIPANYSHSNINRRAINKLALQKRLNLTQDNEIPLIGMVQRLEEQKGFDIFEKALDSVFNETRLQLVILGRGREHYEDMLKRMASRHPEQMFVSVGFDNPLSHLVYAGCDMFLMPSRFEPCGLGQLIAMHYGAIPIVRHTGGLVDTVPQLSLDLETGNGFVFRDYASEALGDAVRRALTAFSDKRAWQRAVKRMMKLDFSWANSARKYETAYQRLLSMRTKRDS